MKVRKITLADCSPLQIESIQSELICEYDDFVADVKNGATELYCINYDESEKETLFAIRTEGRTAIVVFLIGEKLDAFTDWVVKALKQTNLVDYVDAFTKRKGMVKHFDKIGAEHIGTYHRFRLKVE